MSLKTLRSNNKLQVYDVDVQVIGDRNELQTVAGEAETAHYFAMGLYFDHFFVAEKVEHEYMANIVADG